MNQSRIPKLRRISYKAMHRWFGEMYKKGLLFHPDDPPETMIVIKTNLPLFTAKEAKTLSQLLESLFTRYGDRVYEAAYPYFMRSIGNPER